jgi:hypothetical protein
MEAGCQTEAHNICLGQLLLSNPPPLQQQHHHHHKDSKTFTNSQYVCCLQLQEIELMQPALPHHHCKTTVDCFDHAEQSQSELCFFKP